MSIPDNKTNQRFGRLLAVSAEFKRNRRWFWLCRCDCGQSKIVRADHLKRGKVRSCGCLNRELTRMRRLSHGKRKTKIYAVWNMMNQRCSNPRTDSYEYYGGRGIKVRYSSFETFLADMGEPPPGRSIDRINNDGHYEPGNCRWATAKEQRANRRDSIKRLLD